MPAEDAVRQVRCTQKCYVQLLWGRSETIHTLHKHTHRIVKTYASHRENVPARLTFSTVSPLRDDRCLVLPPAFHCPRHDSWVTSHSRRVVLVLQPARRRTRHAADGKAPRAYHFTGLCVCVACGLVAAEKGLRMQNRVTTYQTATCGTCVGSGGDTTAVHRARVQETPGIGWVGPHASLGHHAQATYGGQEGAMTTGFAEMMRLLSFPADRFQKTVPPQQVNNPESAVVTFDPRSSSLVAPSLFRTSHARREGTTDTHGQGGKYPLQ